MQSQSYRPGRSIPAMQAADVQGAGEQRGMQRAGNSAPMKPGAPPNVQVDTVNQRQILTMGEAADFLRFSKAHLSHLVNGKVDGVPPPPCVRVGRRILFRRSSLVGWLGAIEGNASVLSFDPSQHSTQETPERSFHA